MMQDCILEFLAKQEALTSGELEARFNLSTDKIYAEILSLQSNNYIEF